MVHGLHAADVTCDREVSRGFSPARRREMASKTRAGGPRRRGIKPTSNCARPGDDAAERSPEGYRTTAGARHAGGAASVEQPQSAEVRRSRPALLRSFGCLSSRAGAGFSGYFGATRARPERTTRRAPHEFCAPPLSHAHLPPPPLRSDRGKKHKTPEADLQVECVAWTEVLGLTIYGTMGGVFFGGEYGARAARGRAFKARGTSPGIPDLLIFDRGARGEAGLAVELKIGDNRLSPEQEAWLARLRACGWTATVARTLADFQTIVTEYLPEGAVDVGYPVDAQENRRGQAEEQPNVL